MAGLYLRRMNACIPFTVVFIVAAGCGERGPKLWPASGKVVFNDGKPVKFGIIEFAPVGDGPGARATIADDGSFTLKTGDRSGAVAGNHRIVVIQLLRTDGLGKAHHHPAHNSRLTHARHARFETSGLERAIEAEKDNVFTLKVDSGD